jgi:hypothetical protein
MWICIGFNSDPDPDSAFILSQCGSGSDVAKPIWIHADLASDPGQTLASRKVEFLHENKLWV